VALHPSLCLRHSETRGYHVVARGPVAAGAELLSVPLSSCLATRARDPRVRQLLSLRLPPLYVSACLLLAEGARGGGGGGGGGLRGHSALLAALPTPPCGSVGWGPGAAAALEGTALAGDRGAELPLAARFAEAAPFFAAAGPAPPPPLAAFSRAVALLLSRGFQVAGGGSGLLPGAPLLAPGADLFNHHPTAPHAALALRGARLSVAALRAASAGEELTLSYGAGVDDGALLSQYGFACVAPMGAEHRRALRAAGGALLNLELAENPFTRARLPRGGALLLRAAAALCRHGGGGAGEAKRLAAGAAALRRAGALRGHAVALGGALAPALQVAARVLAACWRADCGGDAAVAAWLQRQRAVKGAASAAAEEGGHGEEEGEEEEEEEEGALRPDAASLSPVPAGAAGGPARRLLIVALSARLREYSFTLAEDYALWGGAAAAAGGGRKRARGGAEECPPARLLGLAEKERLVAALIGLQEAEEEGKEEH